MESDTNPGLNTNFSLLIENVELYIKLTNNITIPSIILEHRSNDNLNFNLEDLKQLYYHFGNVIYLINKGSHNASCEQVNTQVVRNNRIIRTFLPTIDNLIIKKFLNRNII